MAIPSVDLRDFLSGNPEEKKQFVHKLGIAYEEIGFVAVKNHGISDKLITDLYQHVQQFFSLFLVEKKQYELKDMAGQRGYTSFGKEHAKGSEAPDLKEFFQYGQIARDGFVDEFYPDNVKVNQVEYFNKTFDDAYCAF